MNRRLPLKDGGRRAQRRMLRKGLAPEADQAMRPCPLRTAARALDLGLLLVLHRRRRRSEFLPEGQLLCELQATIVPPAYRLILRLTGRRRLPRSLAGACRIYQSILLKSEPLSPYGLRHPLLSL